jgi:hypothetical protein
MNAMLSKNESHAYAIHSPLHTRMQQRKNAPQTLTPYGFLEKS